MTAKQKERINLILQALEESYPDAECSLDYLKPYELLIAGRLSAQCTDARVNLVTPELFKKYPTLEAFAMAEVSDVAAIIRPCGLYKTKAKSIVEMTNQILHNFGGELPQTLEELTTLSGVGRKTANLIMGDVFHKPAVVTDTHCIRICGRLGLTKNTEPFSVEKDLLKIIPPAISARFCHQLVHFGREFCRARGPKCDVCPIRAKFLAETGKDLICKL